MIDFYIVLKMFCEICTNETTFLKFDVFILVLVKIKTSEI